jgi:hypothetical protein
MEINERIVQLIKEKSKDRIFPILNKLDRFWTNNSELTFCEVINTLGLNSNLDDLELTKKLDEHIDEHVNEEIDEQDII